ncbi:MAG: undecaprenyl-diphosphate phosphatase [Angelakisella sp.]|jgi:undecaprenyl-diphosphatase|nr:undecaprenyl-diphosphate phosphatase [Angelakisella sp.]MCI9528627.1 undecaprenyl-diphosphate phosphatase [Angelakisella sp.]
MSYFNAIVQGLIQGFTEFLPVSSSGHLSLYQYFTGTSSEESLLFSVMLHFGTLAAVAVAFWPTLWQLLIEFLSIFADLFTGKLFRGYPKPYRRMLYFLMLSCVPLLVVPFVQDFITGFSTDNSIIAEGCFFLITALLLTLGDKAVKGIKTARSMTAQDSVAVGVAQVLATLPGVSRSGSTISAGLMMGLDRSFAVTYSFILGLPAILAAGLLDLKDVVEAGELGIPLGPALVGMAVAAVSGFLSIKLVSYIVRSDKFRIFAWYTLVLGVLVLGIGILEQFTGHAIQQYISSTMMTAFVTVG